MTRPPEGFEMIYEGAALAPFYAAEMLRPHIGRTVWVMDSGGRTRCGELSRIPRVKEDQTDNVPPVEFTDERPLFLRQIVCIALYIPPAQRKG
jgi:hypothetical protein